MSRPKIKKNLKFVAVANLLNLKPRDVLNYVHKLHEHIRRQRKSVNRLKLKIQKMVRRFTTDFRGLQDETLLSFRLSYRNSMLTLPRHPRMTHNQPRQENPREMTNTERRLPSPTKHLNRNRRTFWTLSMKSRLKRWSTRTSRLDSSMSPQAVSTTTRRPNTTTHLSTISTTTAPTALGIA
jgi:hypothetical protein